MILIIGPGGCGFTFLAWTISFLRGDTTHTRLNGDVVPMIDNPLNGTTAHRFAKNHIKASSELYKLDQAPPDSIVYVVPEHQTDIDVILTKTDKKIIFQTSQESSKELFARMCLAVPESSYMKIINRLEHTYDSTIIKKTLLEFNRMFTEYYSVPKTYTDYLPITYADIFENLNEKIKTVFEFIDCSIDLARYTSWLPIYQTYQLQNKNFQEQLVSDDVIVPNKIKSQIIKELLSWKHDSSPQKC